MGSCVTCRHWEAVTTLGEKQVLSGKVGACLLQSGGSWDWDEDLGHLTAIARDGKNETAWLETKASHGCTAWAAAKDQAPKGAEGGE